MSEWWSYGLADFLLFSPRVYFRLFETMNTTWGLAVVSALVAGVIAAGLAMRHGHRGNRVILVVLSLIWAWVSYGFMWQYYQPINWVVPYVLPGLVYPFVGLFEGRDLMQAELFGSAADPTAFGTLGFVLMARGTWRWLLVPVPLIWCLIASATLWVMDQEIAVVPLIAVWLTVFCCWLDLKNGVTTRRMTQAELVEPTD